MPEIKIGVNVNQTTTGGRYDGSGGVTPGKLGAPGGTTPAGADAERKLTAAKKAAAEVLGKSFTKEQIKASTDYLAQITKTRSVLKQFNGDLEQVLRGYKNLFPNQQHGQQALSKLTRELGLGSPSQTGGIGGMLKQAMRGMFRATGMGGGVSGGIMANGIEQARASDGGMGSAGGLGMLGKGALVAGVGYAAIKMVQKVGQKVGDAQDEAVQYHDLRNSVGGASVDFDLLRESVRHFTSNLGISSGESAKLAKQYAASSQIFGEAAQHGIGQAVGQGTALSRGFGIDPSAGVDFLATMRHFKASDGDKDNRKLAWLIGDAVGKTGAFSKADDVMNAIAHFTESTSRQSLQVANVEGYAGLMGALGGMKLPGMDAKGSANLMQQVAGNWASGGGEAGQNMRLGWAQRFGASATDMGAIGDAGPWASAHSTFGKDSALYKLAEGDKVRQAHLLDMAKRGGDKTFYDHEIGSMKSQYGAEFLPMAMMSKYGVSDIGARNLIKASDSEGGIGGLQKRVTGALDGTGKDPAKIGAQQMGLLAGIDQADSKELAAMKANALRLSGKSALNDKEKAALTGAKDDDTLKQVLMQINAFREAEDEGKTAREAQVNLDRKFQEFAKNIIPLTSMIQEGVFKLLDSFGGQSEEMKRFTEGKRYQKQLDEATTEEEKKAVTDNALADAKRGPMSEAEYKKRMYAIDAANGMNIGGAEHTKQLEALDKERQERSEYVMPDAIKAMIAADQNSGGAAVDPRAAHADILNSGTGNSPGAPNIRPNIGGKGPRNLRNNNPGNIEYGDFAKAHGATGSDGRFAIFPDKETGSAAMDSLLQKYSKKDGLNTVSGIVGKWAPPSENDTGAYSKSVAKRMGVTADQTLDMSDPKVSAAIAKEMARIEGSSDAYIPATARAPGGNQTAKVQVSVNGTMTGPDGRQHPVGGEGSGQFQQTSAGMSRG